MKNILNKKMFWVGILTIIFLGVFLRVYNFGDWLHFELDQSRDAKVINLAVEEGPGALPLLGPKAAGSFLRLGPAFYYFKYLSALIFGNTPSGMAVIIMLFGILAMPAFYFLVRRYFERWVSLALLLLFSTSLFLVMYSRFSWNPNAMPLFIILTFYSLLRAVDTEEKRKGWWLLGASFCASVAAQLHFLAFVSVPVIAIIFLIIKRPKIRWPYWVGVVAIVLIMNLPVILNEIKTGGDNFKEFQDVVTGKANKDSEKTLIEKVIKDYTENSLGQFLILSSQNAELPGLVQKNGFDIKCDQGCRNELPLGIIALFIFSIGVILLAKNLFFEKEQKRRDFLVLVSIWFFITFGLFIPLAFDISPRFWLIVGALPFIFLGFSFDFLEKIMPKKIAPFLIVVITIVFTVSNLKQVRARFSELRKAPFEAVKNSADRILKERHRVTLEQQYMIIDYVESFYKKNGYPVYLNSDSFYRRSFLFHLDTRNVPRDDFRNVTSGGQVYKNGNYFLIYPTDSNLDQEMNNYSSAYDTMSKKQFGTLSVIHLAPKPEAITAEEQKIKPQGKSQSAPSVPKRYTWEEIFNEDGGEIEN